MTKSTNPLGDYEVGYRRPPKQHQFQKGQSGNQKGRPKNAATFLEVIEREAAKLVNIKAGDAVERVTKRDAIVRRLLDQALQGQTAALRMAITLLSGIAPPANDDNQIPEPLNDAEREAMAILLERLARRGGADG